MQLVPEGAPIIWDIRGNSGGSVEVAAGIVAGMPGVESRSLGGLYFPSEYTNPRAFGDSPAMSFPMTVVPGSSIDHSDHPTAVLIDGLAVSAADYFAYAAKNYADVLVVGPQGSNGQYGFGGFGYQVVSGPVLNLYHRIDPVAAILPDGTFLERTSVEPDLTIQYRQRDLARGRDSVLEGAARALLRR